MNAVPSAVVTGGSSGIGAATVDALVRAGWKVWPTVRHRDDAARLTERHGPAVQPVLMDLADATSIRAASAIVRAAGPLQALINNAGAATTGPLETLPASGLRQVLEINLVGQLAVTQAFLPALREQAENRPSWPAPRIIMIGSIGGRVALPMLGAYAASKHGLAAMTESLAAELHSSGIRVVLLEPGATATQIWITASPAEAQAPTRYADLQRRTRERALRSARHGMSPDVVAAAVLREACSVHPGAGRVVGLHANALAALQRILPRRAFRALLRKLA